MIFIETPLKNSYVIEIEKKEDERGFFARTFCENEFKAKGLETKFVQCNLSFNAKRGTLRGMHYQAAPHQEIKIVSCVKGSIYDVIVDLREGSATYLKWFAVELKSSEYKMLYIPGDFAHGFQTLEDDTTVYYQMGCFYDAASARGILWNDKKLGIEWPVIEPKIISSRDINYDVL